MLSKNYHLSTMEWSYNDITSIDYFLADFKNELTKDNVTDNLKLLADYRDRLTQEELILVFGNCKLKVKGIDEVVATIRGLEYVYEKYFSNR